MNGSVLLLHGYTATPDRHWLPWLGKQLREHGFAVESPALPSPDEPQRDKWVKEVEQFVATASKPIILVGHSLGATTILRYLEKKPIKPIRAAMLVAAPTNVSIQQEKHPGILHFLGPDPFDFDSIKANAEIIEAFVSLDDDSVPAVEGEPLRDLLKASYHVFQDKGHFRDRDGVTEFPELLERILGICNERT